MNAEKTAHLILRVGVAFSFLYAAIDGFVDPYSWIDYFPQFLNFAPTLTLLHVFAVIEILIALWLLSGKNILIPSLLATVMLLAVVIFNLAQFQLLFRDVSIAAASLALAMFSLKDTRGQGKTARLP